MRPLRRKLLTDVPVELLLCIAAAVLVSSAAIPLPKVNLGYVTQQASEYRAEANKGPPYDIYKFNNIQYAASTGGLNRFSVSQYPSTSSTTTSSDGTVGYTCPQAYSNPNLPLPEDEDCLFLDVQVPKVVFDGKTRSPVVVYIHGGGFETGYKTSTGDPAGLIIRSREFGDKKGAVYVAIQYRLGAYGWLGGPNWAQSATPNLGLHDQLLALQWVQKYISLFGGDPARVTVMGQSAGGASIMHHLTAYGGAGTPPFKRAIVQSPAFAQRPDPAVSNLRFQQFLQLAGGLAGLADLRRLSPAAFYARNQQFQQSQPFGVRAAVPVPDGAYVLGEPGQLLAQGRFYRGVDLLVARVHDEGFFFTDPGQTASAGFAPTIKNFFPTMPQASLDQLANGLYPADYSGAQGYASPFDRLRTAIGDALVNCNLVFLNQALNNADHEYIFGVGRAQHGDDVGYSFYTGGESNPSAGTPGGQVLTDQAFEIQRWIMQFVVEGKVAGDFPTYGAQQSVQNVTDGGIVTGKDSTRKNRCAFWQTGRLGP